MKVYKRRRFIIGLFIAAMGFIFGFMVCQSQILGRKTFGEYCFDGKYRYVVTYDETSECCIVSVVDDNWKVAYHTTGYMGMGAHYGIHTYVEVEWSPNSYNFFVWDSRGTQDVFIYDNGTWIGPYQLQNNNSSDSHEYVLADVGYAYKLEYPDPEREKNIGILYDENTVPDRVKERIKS